ncbi:mucin-5B-like [Astyanax mexicanus]|uniref:Mucin-5B-like n=1 Tax=Astyanax mexicanus TaxID=7994 RepID=A0A8T2MBU6_ASTMX|nr:mucin-5B-like [Astyanax mexicanus]
MISGEPLQQNCVVQKNSTYLKSNNCTSENLVEMTFCSGSCQTLSMYSMEANSMMHHCSCCREQRTSEKVVQLNCPNQTQRNVTYTFVEECGCEKTKCTDGDEPKWQRIHSVKYIAKM